MPTAQELQQYQQLLNLFAPRQTQTNWPQIGLGTALMGSTLLGREEPGYVTEARQNVRNLSSPTGFSSGFTNTVGGLQGQFEPFLKQQEEDQVRQLQQRYAAAFPMQGMQGGEIASLGRLQSEQFMPRRQAFLGEIGMQGLNTQFNAAKTILDAAKPDPFKEGLAALGGSLILGGQGQGGLGGFGGFGTGTGGGILDSIGNLLGGGGGTGGGGTGGLPGNLLGGGGNGLFGGAASVGQLAQLAKLGLSLGNSVGSGREILDATGYPVGVMDASGQVTDMFGNPVAGTSNLGGAGGTSGFWAPQASGTTGWAGLTSGTGLMGTPSTSSAAGIGSGLVAAGAGYAAGSTAAPYMTDFANRDDAWKWLNPGAAGLESLGASDQAVGAYTGAQAGALTGFVTGGPIGAAIGALTGAIGGFSKVRAAEHAFKAQRSAADQAAQGGNVGKFGSFWTEALGSAGYQGMDEWNALVQKQIADTPGGGSTYSAGGITISDDQPNAMIRIGSQLLLKEIQKTSPQITSLDMIPSFREGYISWIMSNLKIESGGGVIPIQNIGQAGGYVTMAGLPGP